MKVLKKISEFLGKYMAIIVLAIAALSLFFPKSTIWIQTGWVNYLLMAVMFGMGLTLKLDDFRLVFTRPKDMIIGCASQFIVMPLLAFVLSRLFGLDPALTAGMVLVGTCPGGTSSNVITYLSKVEFLTYNEGLCVQCMHIGRYDDEPATVELMHEYAKNQGYEIDITDRRYHHEIYLSDARRVAPEKLKTVVRHPIKKK